MMTPSVAPLVLGYAAVGRTARGGAPFAATAWFASGYAASWTLFALAAAAVQWALQRAALLTATMSTAARPLGAAILIAAGVYQWTRLKAVCLTHCRSPRAFLQHNDGFRPDAPGAFAMGLHHGSYCVGCCWVLMALLFVGGVMNAAWIALLTALVLAEKVVPQGRLVARAAGVLLLAGGIWTAV
jgi:predicted metal-binding membrane protein